MKSDSAVGRVTSFVLATTVFLAGLTVLAVRLYGEQVERADEHRRDMAPREFRRVVKTAGLRGRILDRRGVPLAVNRLSLVVEADPGAFRPRAEDGSTATNIAAAVAALEPVIGRPPLVRDAAAVAAKLRRDQVRPVPVWRDLTDAELARFCEHAREHPGFACVSASERLYPQGSLAAHILGRVGSEDVRAVTGSVRVKYSERQPSGREGLELRYDEFLCGVPGEDRLVVDARGRTIRRETVVPASSGCDLTLTLDVPLQRAVEAQLAGCRGACVALDPRSGAILACASAPTFDPNECVPVLTSEVYARLRDDPEKPLLNRATAGTYAPGSTFKPITALAGLAAGWTRYGTYTCSGAYELGALRIRCGRTWGHGALDLPAALRESCNPFFCSLGMRAGTNALMRMARTFGLGSRTGVDFPTDAPGVVPDDAWKRAHYGTPWYPGDLAQMSLGQGMLLVTPLQMARVAAALGTGRLVTPRFLAEPSCPPVSEPVQVPPYHLAIVREGMRQVVDGGTGRRAGLGVCARVIGKTGTAEVGSAARRRKNTWFIAYAEPDEASREKTPLAVALVIEDGESGGGTAAPKVAEILKAFYNPPQAAP